MTARASLLVVAVFGAACTFEEGHGFTTLRRAMVSARLEPGPARDLGDNTVLTDLGFAVKVERAAWTLDRAVLLSRTGSTSSGGFDPAHPPPGYTFCHGGHCHATDGRLVSYEDIEAELSGGQTRFSPVVTLPCRRELDLLSRATRQLDAPQPSAELPEADLARAELTFTGLALEATVTQGLSGAELPAPSQLAVQLPGNALSKSFAYRIDRHSSASVELVFDVVLDGTLFDGVPFDQRAHGDAVVLSADDTSTVFDRVDKADVLIRLQ